MDSVQKEGDALDKILGKWIESVDGISTHFCRFMELFAADVEMAYKVDVDLVKFVVFIDDLDRCLPDTTVQVLENIKNHLTAPRCVYVLGINPDVVYQGIRSKYHGLEISGQEYLEKIINYSFYMPVPSDAHISKFGVETLSELTLGFDKVATYGQAFSEFGAVLAECRFNNPRKIKRILNTYLYFLSSQSRERAFDVRNVVRFIILAESFPDLFPAIINGPAETLEAARDVMAGTLTAEAFEARFGVRWSVLSRNFTRYA